MLIQEVFIMLHSVVGISALVLQMAALSWIIFPMIFLFLILKEEPINYSLFIFYGLCVYDGTKVSKVNSPVKGNDDFLLMDKVESKCQ